MPTEAEIMESSVRRFVDVLHEKGKDGFYGRIYSNFIACDPAKRQLTFWYDMPQWCSNYAGAVHGGLIASVFDQCAGILAYWCAGEHICKTVNMQLTYLRPVPVNSRLVVEATCTSAGRTLLNLTARAWVQGADPEKLAATAAVTFFSGAKKPS